MNGKPKSGVRSSGPGQGNNEQDDRFNFQSTDELKSFFDTSPTADDGKQENTGSTYLKPKLKSR